MRRLLSNPIAYMVIFLLTVISCRKDEQLFVSKPTEYYDSQVAHVWMDMFRTLTKKTSGFTPPVAARAFGYVGVTLYETVVPGMPQYQSLSGQLDKMPALPELDASLEYNWAISVNAAMAYMARNLYATTPTEQLSAILKLEDAQFEKLKNNVDEATINRSKEWGLTVAKSIFEWSKTDGGHEGYSKNFPATYTPPTGAGMWVSTYPAFQKALQPFWGNNRTFITKCAENTQPDAPTPYSEDDSSKFVIQANETYLAVKNQTQLQKTIAQYWSDDPGEPGTPPGHLLSVATQVLQKENSTLAKSAETYSKISIGLSDAFVSCWKCKFQFNYIRPISYIRTKIDANWVSLLTTPPFPEYTSGHSVASGASSKILTDLFGNTYEFTDRTHEFRTDINGSPRTYRSFNDMAAEAAVSRLYGGIHFREAIEKGVEQGVRVGTEVGNLKYRK